VSFTGFYLFIYLFIFGGEGEVVFLIIILRPPGENLDFKHVVYGLCCRPKCEQDYVKVPSVNKTLMIEPNCEKKKTIFNI